MKVLVTGANGFVGAELCIALAAQGYKVKAAMRTPNDLLQQHSLIEVCSVSEIEQTDWKALLAGVDIVIHLAARVHQMNDTGEKQRAEYYRINVLGTEKIIEAALAVGVKRLVYLSTIKVNGEESSFQGFTELDVPAPQDPYALSKWQAEQLIAAMTQNTNLEFVVIRTPLVYGKRVRANFANLIKLVGCGLPLPFASVKNHRSFICLENLISVLLLVAVHPQARKKTYLVADAEPVSTAELIRAIAKASNKKVWLFSMSPKLLKFLARLMGKEAVAQRLLANLAVNTSLIKRDLGWLAPVTLQDGLKRMFNT